jgi:hypothetical protein
VAVRLLICPLYKGPCGRLGSSEKIMKGFHYFPIQLRGSQKVYEALSFKILKELKVAVMQYGPTAPFTLGIVETLVSEPLPHVEWKAIAKACLSEVIICYGDLSFKIDALVKPIGIRHPDLLNC